ncbi:MAG: hypothetical protein HQL95_04540 [Magnetococcales bacterium]|nr:hypothetical protein [Magnetococcales bacterium]
MSSLETARKSWGVMPPWVEALAQACDRASQDRAARAIGYGGAVVNQVLQGKYKGSLSRVEAAVRAVFMGELIDCPALGEILVVRCSEERKKPFAATNPTRVQMWQACRGCDKGGSR